MRVKPSPASVEIANNVVFGGRIIVGHDHLHHFFCLSPAVARRSVIAPDGSLGALSFPSGFNKCKERQPEPRSYVYVNHIDAAADGPQGPAQITKCRGFFTIPCDLVTLVNALFTTFGELCACRSPVSILYRIVHGFRTGVNIAPEEAFRRSDFARRRPFPAGNFGATLALCRRQSTSGRFDEQQTVLSRNLECRSTAPGAQFDRAAQPIARNAGTAHRPQCRQAARPSDFGDRDPPRAIAPRDAQPREPALAGTRRPQRAEPRSTAARARRCRACRKATPAYQSLAREFDRVRGQEDSVAAVGKIAGELKGLREELRHQMTTGLAREFDALRKDIERAYSSPLTAKNGAELGAEFERLSGAIQSLSEKTDDKSIKLLRLELEQVRGALDSLAREDTVRSVDRRWDDFDARFSKFEDRFDAQSRERASDPAIEALTSRLEQINDAVNDLPESLSLRSLEDKVRTLAGAVDHFARQQDGTGNAPFDLIEERLDEISRAIVASTATATSHAFRPRTVRADRGAYHLACPSDRGTGRRSPGRRGDRPPQPAVAARRRDRGKRQAAGQGDRAPGRRRSPSLPTSSTGRRPRPIPTTSSSGIEQRFDMLSDLLDRRQGDAIEHGQAVFRDLERRLEELAGRLDERSSTPAIDSAEIMNVIDARLEELAGRIDERGSAAAAKSAGIMNAIDARFEELAHRLESRAQAQLSDRCHRASRSAAGRHLVAAGKLQRAGDERRSRHHPQSGIAGLRTVAASVAAERARCPNSRTSSRASTTSSARLPATARSILEAARQAAENAVRSFSGSKSDAAAVSALADDLQIARRADPAFRRTQHQDVRSDPRHAAQDRRPARLARRAPASRPSPNRCEAAGAQDGAARCAVDRARRRHAAHGDAATPGASQRNARRRRRSSARRPKPRPRRRSPRSTATRRSRAAEPVAARCSAASRGPLAGKKERAEPAMTEPPSLPGMDVQAPNARPRPAARSQARQPSARARLRHAGPQRDHAAGARRTRRSRPRNDKPTPPNPTSSPPRGAPRRRPLPKPRS